MNEFEHTLTNILAKHGISVSDLAERAGYSPLFFSTVVSGKSRHIPVTSSYELLMSSTLAQKKRMHWYVHWLSALSVGVKRSHQRCPGLEPPRTTPPRDRMLGLRRRGHTGPLHLS